MPGPPRRRWSLGPFVAVMFVLFALGCAPSMAKSGYGSGGGDYRDYAEQDYAYTEYGGEGGVAYGEDALASPASPMPEEAPRRLEKSKDKLDSKKLERRNTATATTAATGSTEAEPPPPPAPEDEPVAAAGRQIIYTAGMGLSVFDVDDVMAKLEAIPERHGGWLHQRYDRSLILRVPAAKLDSIIAEISEWGVVEWRTLQALDVTAEYTDLDSRIRTLEQMQGHLEALLARAENVEQALEIQMELSRITAELEQLRAQMRMLESSIAFSTLAVELHERGAVEPEPGDDPFPWVDELGAEATAYR